MTQYLMLFVVTFFVATPSEAAGIELVVSTEPVAQGGISKISLKNLPSGSKVRGSWQGEPVEFFQTEKGEYDSLVGIDLKLMPGTYPLKVYIEPVGDPPLTVRKNLTVVAKDYGLQRLSLPERMVSLDAATIKRVREEGARFSALWHKRSRDRYWRGSFILPVSGEVSTPFGRRRMINDKPRSPHSGVDLRAALGQSVRAANHGRVALVGEFYFHGRAVVIDHGWGLYTMYFHLSEVYVAQGDFVEKESVLGLAGSTGRSTGPHLHWGVRLGGARVDPLALLRVTGE